MDVGAGGHEGAHAGADGFEMLGIAVGFRGGFVPLALDEDEGLGVFALKDFVGQTAFFIGVDGGGHFLGDGEKISLGALFGPQGGDGGDLDGVFLVSGSWVSNWRL